MNGTHSLHDSPAQPWNRSFARSAFAPFAAASMLFVAGTAWAADAKAPPALLGPVLTEKTMVVKFDDLELATDSGARMANERLLEATRKACDFTTRAGDYVVGRAEIHRACVARTMAAAVAQLEQLRLVATLHAGAKVAGNEAAEPESPGP